MYTCWRYVCASLALVLILVALSDVVPGKSMYVLGEEEHPWNEPGASLQEVDVLSRPGWIGRQQVGPEDNLALGALARGGRTWTSWDTGTYFLSANTDAMVDGKRNTGPFFVQVWPMGAYRRWTVYLDLGGQFGVNRVKVLAGESGDWLRDWIFKQYEIGVEGLLPQWIEVGVNDGDPGAVDVYGHPLLEPVWGETREVFPDLDVTFPTRPTRYVGVTTVARADLLAISELEVYGEGYVPRGVYVSPIIDMGDLADFGRVRWEGQKDPGAEIRMYTRTGEDSDPKVYWRKTEEGKLSRLDEEGRELTAETYEALKSSQKGGITYDREHWSFWSRTSGLEGDEGRRLIASPSPRRYIQVKVEFLGTYGDIGELDWVGFEVSQPPVAHYVEGEIWPVEVRPSERTTFSYAIRPRMKGEDRGFDRLEIRTPIPVDSVRTVVRDGVQIPFEVEVLEDPPRFVVYFPKVDVNGMLLELTFDATVLRYGTTFEGWVFESTTDEVAQRVIPGDATPKLEGNTLSVKTVLGPSLITLTGAVPNPFTPNEDGVNDETVIGYDVLQLTGPAPVSVKVYDGMGRMVRRVYVGEDAAGRYARVWDGRDEEGKLVPPGTYLYRVSVFLPVARSKGNSHDLSNERTLIYAYGLPTAREIYGCTVEVDDWHGLGLVGEWNVSRGVRQFPNPTIRRHTVADTKARGWYLNVFWRHYPLTLALEHFGMDDAYRTTAFGVDRGGNTDYADAWNYLYEFVEDNDDFDQVPDSLSKGGTG